MSTINLAYPDRNTIRYVVSKMPDGQQDIVINNYTDSETPVLIKSRFNNFKDLELIICATAALRHLGVKRISLFVPYLLGARGDRKFQIGGTRYLKDVVAPIINSLKFEKVTIYDAHSTVVENVIDNVVCVPTESVFLYSKFIEDVLLMDGNYYIVSPDAGAIKKVENIAKLLHYKKDIIVCSKHRDVDGKITGTNVPILEENIDLVNGDTFIIFDDICDGGRTFTEIAKAIKANYKNSDTQPVIYLYVTHGIFSAGFLQLYDYFDKIICTNSYSDVKLINDNGDSINDIPVDFVEQTDIW